MSQSVLGWVYVLTNPSFKEGMIKIGFTNKPTPQERAAELSKHTGVPTEFAVVYAVKVPDAQAVEERVHDILHDKRARNNREFFECSINEAVKTIQSVAGKTIVQTMDYRKRQPEKMTEKSSVPTKTSSAAKKHAPKTIEKKRSFGLIGSLLMLLILFLIAMFFVGLWAEKRDNPSATQPPSSPQPTVRTVENTPIAPATNEAQTLNTARQNMQLAWDKIPENIQQDLQKEQTLWLKNLPQKCQQREMCLIQEYEQRAAYLRGFSIR